MRLPRDRGAAAAHQEVHVDSFVCLIHVVAAKPQVTAHVVRRGSLPLAAPLLELGVGHIQVQAAFVYVQLDQSPFLTRASGPPTAASGEVCSTTVP